ncbi:putative papain-like cysteine peptidase superfamily [Helianthus anomalus]
MTTNTCYNLDSIRNRTINPVLRQIINAEIALCVVQSGTGIEVKVNWVNAKCPYQTGGTECGYYVLKFMKRVVGGGKVVYMDEDIDGIGEGCSSYGAMFKLWGNVCFQVTILDV